MEKALLSYLPGPRTWQRLKMESLAIVGWAGACCHLLLWGSLHVGNSGEKENRIFV